jgi:hypothetical protein
MPGAGGGAKVTARPAPGDAATAVTIPPKTGSQKPDAIPPTKTPTPFLGRPEPWHVMLFIGVPEALLVIGCFSLSPFLGIYAMVVLGLGVLFQILAVSRRRRTAVIGALLTAVYLGYWSIVVSVLIPLTAIGAWATLVGVLSRHPRRALVCSWIGVFVAPASLVAIFLVVVAVGLGG